MTSTGRLAMMRQADVCLPVLSNCRWGVRQILAYFVALPLAFAFADGGSEAQDIPRLMLAGQPEKSSVTYTAIGSVRELSDGRVIVADNTEKRLDLLNLQTGHVIRLGREGRGPGEYLTLGNLLAARADSTWLVDIGNSRVLVLDESGRGVRTFSTARAGAGDVVRLRADRPGSTGGPRFMPQYLDTLSRVYEAVSNGNGELAVILRYPSIGMAADTLAFIRLASGRTIRTQRNAAVLLPDPFSGRDEWAVHPDGTVVIARVDEYRIELVRPDGTTYVGQPVPHRESRITASDRSRYIDQLRQNMGRVVDPQTVESTVRAVEFPERKAPFRGALWLAPDGDIWIQLSGDDAEALQYDVLDDRGALRARLIMPPRTRIVQLGTFGVYTVRTDDVDLQHLERYPWAALRGDRDDPPPDGR